MDHFLDDRYLRLSFFFPIFFPSHLFDQQVDDIIIVLFIDESIREEEYL